jgi:hypothetical protein
VTGGLFGAAKAAYVSLHPDEAGQLTSGAFVSPERSRSLGLFGWQLLVTPEINPQIEATPNTKQFQMHVSISSGARALTARKLLFLDPGAYTLNIAYEPRSPQSESGLVVDWQLRCLNGKSSETIWRNDQRLLGKAEQFSIPTSCEAQSLDLTLAGGSGQVDADLVVRNVHISR